MGEPNEHVNNNLAYKNFYFSHNKCHCIINDDTPSDSSPVPINAGEMEVNPLPGDTGDQKNKICDREQEVLKEQKEKEQKESEALLGNVNIDPNVQKNLLTTASNPYKDNTY